MRRIFNICPANPNIQKMILPNVLAQHQKIRTPLLQRAACARGDMFIFPGMARLFCEKTIFDLEGNKFSLSNKSNQVSQNEVALMLAHFGSIARDIRINVLIEDNFSTSRQNTVRINGKSRELVFLSFEIINNQDVEIRNSRSSTPGFGSRALIALYNLAKDLELNEIYYTPKDKIAQTFYFHMDYVSKIAGSAFHLRVR